MYLSRFGVKNYKCLGEIDIPLTPIHVLIGQNDCGKTSLLEAMAALCASSAGRLGEAFSGPWNGRELVRHAASESIVDLSADWAANYDEKDHNVRLPLRYHLAVDFSRETGGCSCSREEIDIQGESRSLLPPGITGSEWTTFGNWKKEGKHPKGVAFGDLHELSSVLKPAHRYALSAKQMAVPAAFDPTRKFRLDPDGFGLATLLDDILGYDPELFLRLRAEFCRFFPQFKGVRVESVVALNRHYDPSGIHGSNSTTGKGIFFETVAGQTVRAQQASDGAILFLGFLALAYLPDPPNLLLIEEPENGVYPKRLDQVITLLKQLIGRTEGVRFPQIILTTHSPYVLSFFEPEEVTLLSREENKPDSPVRARPLRDAPNIRERLGKDFYLGELWYNLSEGELFRDAASQSSP